MLKCIVYRESRGSSVSECVESVMHELMIEYRDDDTNGIIRPATSRHESSGGFAFNWWSPGDQGHDDGTKTLRALIGLRWISAMHSTYHSDVQERRTWWRTSSTL